MKIILPVMLLALLAASPGAAQFLLLQDGLSGGSAKAASASYFLEHSTGFPFGGMAASASYHEAGGFYPIGAGPAGVAANQQGGTAQPLPKNLTLDRPWPNPGLQPTIRFGLPRNDRVLLRVYNIIGQEVSVLLDGDRPAGWHSVRWNGRDERGRTVATGVYLLRLTAAGRSLTQKLTVVR